MLQYLKSKTVWLGLLVTVLGWVQSTVFDAGVAPEHLGVVGTMLGAVIVWLRKLTTEPLEDK